MIRKANKKDITRINELGLKLHDNFEKLFNIEKEIDNPISILLVSDDNLLVNAFLYAQEFADNIDLLSIIVDNNYRSLGIGSNLINYLINEYNKPIILEVASTNKIALKLYEKFGFKVINIRKNYYQNDDAYVMKRGI